MPPKSKTAKARRPVKLQPMEWREEDVIKTLFDMIADKGLGKARLSDLAERLDVPLHEVYARYPSVDSILAAFIDRIDRDMIENAPSLPQSAKRDIYFDMMMARIDFMQAYRAGVVRWLSDLMKQPTLWASTLARWEQSLSLMLDIAKDSPLFPVKKLGLAGIYLTTLHAWMRDDSAEMSKTMAALDQALGKAERFGQPFIKQGKGAAHRPTQGP